MRHIWVVVFYLVTSLKASVVAQDKPLAEITGAYQFNHLTASADGQSTSANVSAGFDANINVPITRWFGAVGDIGRAWKTETASVGTVQASGTASIWTYGGGPQLTYRTPYVHPFARFILGEAHSSAFASVSGLSGVSAGASVNTFFFAPGGGADFRITHNVWLRAGADYFRTSKDGVTVNGAHAFGGITFVFGSKGEAQEQDRPAATEQAQRTTATPPPQPSNPRSTSSGMKIDALGVTVALGRNAGAEITYEAPNGVAALAGLHRGDVINTVDGKAVKTPMELAEELANRPAGGKVRIGYMLHGEWQIEAVVLLAQ
jgi:S1-C subfamily serine protease